MNPDEFNTHQGKRRPPDWNNLTSAYVVQGLHHALDVPPLPPPTDPAKLRRYTGQDDRPLTKAQLPRIPRRKRGVHGLVGLLADELEQTARGGQ